MFDKGMVTAVHTDMSLPQALDEIKRLKELIEMGCKRISDLEYAHMRIISLDDDQEVEPHVLADISREVMKL